MGLYINIFIHKYICTQTLLHTKYFHTQIFLHTNTFTHKPFYTQTLLHTNACTHKHFYMPQNQNLNFGLSTLISYERIT